MDLNYLLNILLRRKWLLFSVVLVSALSTYFLLGQLPDTYKAESVIETGIINYKGPSLQRDNVFIQKFQIESNFSGLIEKMKSRSIIKSLTEKLLAHDLLTDGVSEKPFRTPDLKEARLSQNEIDDIALALKTSLKDSAADARHTLSRSSTRLAEAYGYDYESLMKKLEVNRIGETDYIKVEFESDDPELSFFVVNTYLKIFIEQYNRDLTTDEDQVLSFNRKKLRQVKAELDSVILAINKYKTQHGLVDVTTQRESIISQKKDLELKLQDVEQTIPSLQRNIAYLENQIIKYNKITANEAYNQLYYNEEFTSLGDEITQLQRQIVEAKVNGNKNTGVLEKRLESLKEKRAESMRKSLSVTPKSEKEEIDAKLKELITRHLDKKLELELAKEARQSYRREIARLERKANNLLVNDNELYKMLEEKDRLDAEYDKIRVEYEQSEYLAEGTESPIKIVEPVEQPTEPESKHRALFSAFAGVAGGTMVAIFLFLLAFLDRSIATPHQFSRITGLPLQGYVNKVKMKNIDLRRLFSEVQPKEELEYFKENIRKIRTVIESSGHKVFLFTSPKEQEGKSFLLLVLAYALSLNNRRVLIIDTNFKNNTLSGVRGKSSLVLSTTGKNMVADVAGEKEEPDSWLNNIDIIGNKGGNHSPSEILANKDFGKIMEKYKAGYDFIFMEGSAMNKYSDARELLPYADQLAVVFSSEVPVTSVDKDTLQYLRSLNGKLFGGLLNKVDLKNI